MNTNLKRKWWKEVVVYQLYPRSFKDSDGDGVGDLKGIIEKLDYLQSLGIDVVWINPVYESPNDDMGYDISDYRAIMKQFGTMNDFDILLAGLHKRGIKLIMDLVVNHTSDEHEWFKESRKSRDNLYRNYYHWWNAENGKPPYRWSIFDKDNNAWKYDATTNSYYLHIFSEKQPDLNWENPQVRKEVYDLMKFWMDKGIDGFRLDVITCISKDITFPELPKKMPISEWFPYYSKGPNLHNYLQEMYREVFAKYDCMNVGEMSSINTENALLFVDENRNELQTFYHFEHSGMGIYKENFMYADANNWDLVEWKKIFDKWDKTFAENGWNTIYLGNHDMSRMVSRFGNDTDAYRELSAKMLHTFLLSMRATPYIYNGDEIGMSNTNHTNIDYYQDVYTINYYNQLKQKGEDYQGFLNSHAKISRDNARTPMQWNSKNQAGFTTGKPWLAVNKNYESVNVSEQEERLDSVLHFFRKLIQLRKNNVTLVYGKFELIDPNNKQIFAYTRQLDNQILLVVLNFSDNEATLNLKEDISKAKILISNYEIASYN
ncbi:MAG: alpha-glucosidase, partial [Sediminibacterium sp.]|nr:alpha-glucosidase [Sediminibacterium sp.]